MRKGNGKFIVGKGHCYRNRSLIISFFLFCTTMKLTLQNDV